MRAVSVLLQTVCVVRHCAQGRCAGALWRSQAGVIFDLVLFFLLVSQVWAACHLHGLFSTAGTHCFLQLSAACVTGCSLC